MRLIHATTFQVREFFDINVPPYAILSHTWGDDEVSFQDIQQLEVARMKAGFAKIEKCCKQAVNDKLGWVWIDTCCIDKSSSAELTEAINSMFQWYKNAKVCYAYLSDVVAWGVKDVAFAGFVGSRWFTRGWTLQELIAPETLVFFDNSWIKFGTKESLYKSISSTTGIDEYCLFPGVSTVNHVSIAKRMSWASKRKTTRVEDMAYCLMGLFGVNMPLLYGEGLKAFERLQEEIIKHSEDQSIFSWTCRRRTFTDGNRTSPMGSGLLATSPGDFACSGNVVPFQLPFLSTPFWMTNRGLRIELPLSRQRTMGLYTAILACQREGESGSVISVDLFLLDNDKFCRNENFLGDVSLGHLSAFTMNTIYVKADSLHNEAFNLTDSFYLTKLDELSVGKYSLIEVQPVGSWNPLYKSIRKIKTSAPHEQIAGLLFETHEGGNFVVALGFAKSRRDFRPWTTIRIRTGSETLADVLRRSRALGGNESDVKFCEKDIYDDTTVNVELTTEIYLGFEVTAVNITTRKTEKP